MKQEDKLRNSLREFYDNQELPFNDNEWERASAYLTAARRKRNIRYGALILTALLSTLFVTLFNFQKTSNDNTHLASSPSKQKAKSAPTPQSTVLPAPLVSAPKTKINFHSNPKNKGSDYSTPSLISVTETGRSNSEEHVILPPGKHSKGSEAGITASEPALIKNQTTVKENVTSDVDPLVTPVIPVNAPVSTANSITADDTKQNNLNTTVIEEPKENTEIIPVANENLSDSQNQVSAKEIPQGPIDGLSQPATTLPLNENKKEIATTNYSEFTSLAEKVVPSAFDTARYSTLEGVSGAIETTEEYSVTPIFIPITDEGIFYEAGAAWNYGWKGPVNRDARGFSPVVGINYMTRLNRRCAISFGLQYLQVNNLSNSSKTSRVSTYVYGESSNVTVVTPSTLHYLLAPLRFHYYVNHQNSFGAGINLAYLLNVDAKVTNYEERPGFTGDKKTIKLSGYTEGFSWFDCQLAFFYRRKITKSLAVQAEIFIGLTDVKQNEFFGFSNTERNSGAKLSLVYFAFRRQKPSGLLSE